MSYLIKKASGLLSPFVKQYWMIDQSLKAGVEHIQRIIPSGLTELSFFFSDPPKALNESKAYDDHAIISGQQTGYYDLRITGKINMFSVSLQPLGASLFFNIPLDKIQDQNIALRDFGITDLSQLEDELFEGSTFEKRIEIIEKFLTELFITGKNSYDQKRIYQCIKAINTQKGAISIDHLANTACLSKRQFERVFKNIIGLSPKRFLRIVRFQNAIHSYRPKSIQLTDLAYSSGYFDQSHMIHDFKAFTGLKPSDFLHPKAVVFSDYFS